MCGIVGYVGEPKEKQAKKIIIEGLKRLEYRGYDSAGIALYVDGVFETRKHVGGLENLEKIIGDEKFNSHILSVGLEHSEGSEELRQTLGVFQIRRWILHGSSP